MVLQYINYFTHCVLYYSTCNLHHGRQRSLANKDTLHNLNSKGMFVYMDSEYIYLQEDFFFFFFFFNNYFDSSFQIKYQIHFYNVYKSKHKVLQWLSFTCSHCACTGAGGRGYLHCSISTNVIFHHFISAVVTEDYKHSNNSFSTISV